MALKVVESGQAGQMELWSAVQSLSGMAYFFIPLVHIYPVKYFNYKASMRFILRRSVISPSFGKVVLM
jgi:hypothetical protein